MTSFAGGAAQAAYVARVRDAAPQHCLVVPIDVGKHAAMALIADHYGQVVGTPIEFDPRWPYVLSLLYLSLAGTSLAFGLYLVLMRRIGPSRAAYTSVLFPVVALAVSTAFEGYRWSLPAFIGLAVLVAGNALALGGRVGATSEKKKWLPELDSNQRPTD